MEQVVDKGLGKNPQKSELIHWRQCLLSGGTEACSLGLRETLACTHVTLKCHSHVWRVDTATRKTLKKRNACYEVRRLAVENKSLNGLRSEQVKDETFLEHNLSRDTYFYAGQYLG